MIVLDLVEPPTKSPAEVELWAAVLDRAIEDLAGGYCPADERPRIQREVRRWFTSRDRSRGSFLWVCQVLGLDSGATRRPILGRQQLEMARTSQIKNFSFNCPGRAAFLGETAPTF